MSEREKVRKKLTSHFRNLISEAESRLLNILTTHGRVKVKQRETKVILMLSPVFFLLKSAPLARRRVKTTLIAEDDDENSMNCIRSVMTQ